MLDLASCSCLSFSIVFCAADTVVSLWQDAGHADVCTKPQPKADEHMIWSRGVTASGYTKRGAFVSNSKAGSTAGSPLLHDKSCKRHGIF